MTPEEIERAKSSMGSEETKGWETGYRGWPVRFPKEVKGPRLGSVTGYGRGWWEPEDVEEIGPFGEKVIIKEVRSNWDPKVDEPFERTSKGLYSLRSLKAVKEHYPGEDIYGAVTPYGKTKLEPGGYRAEKAIVRSLFRGLVKCSICGKPAKYLVHNGEKWSLCERDLRRLERLVRAKNFTLEEIEEVIGKLADVYQAEIVSPPED